MIDFKIYFFFYFCYLYDVFKIFDFRVMQEMYMLFMNLLYYWFNLLQSFYIKIVGEYWRVEFESLRFFFCFKFELEKVVGMN